TVHFHTGIHCSLSHRNRLFTFSGIFIIAKECGIKTKITFYTARHTFATLSLKKGVNLYMLKQAFGHQSIKTTEAYVEDFNREELDQAFENLF
ncbi:tyrosine-type recombinase/integrase, partial [Myroides marinus]|uniref:tyrosine-type recombinase/integrase n=1 Tax=Myroides marinus TaxID=703342 RepID=UPI0025774626